MRIFLDSIRKDIESFNWHSALALSLTLPDICGKIDYPTYRSGKRFKAWFDMYVRPKYALDENHPTRQRRGITHLISGGDAYALRCSYLHEGTDDISEQDARDVFDRFLFTSRPNLHRNVTEVAGVVTVQLNIANFCNDILEGVEQWLVAIAGDATKQAKLATRINIDLDPNQPGGIAVGPSVDAQYADRRVILDGNRFIRCTFDNCQMVFTGTAPVFMEGCTVRANCTFHLEGTSMHTIGYLTSLYKDGGVQSVENVFNQIREGPQQ